MRPSFLPPSLGGRSGTLLATIAIGVVLDVAHSDYLIVPVAGLEPGSVMTWLEQQLQTSSLPRLGEL